MDPTTVLRRLPQVDRLVSAMEESGACGAHARSLIVACAREVVEARRREILAGADPESLDLSIEGLAAKATRLLGRRMQPSLQRAINATGVILHTNLGRAPLSAKARRAAEEAATGYSTLELDLTAGRRGSRHAHVEGLLREVTGAEAGLAVNNNAAAVLLALTALAQGREVIVSRGELVEIGGSFRMPDVMAASGAHLVEVGTTNKTYARDYERAITSSTALLLKVHRSNFTLTGFVHEPALEELVALGRRAGLPVMFDLGSGCLVDLAARRLPHEPTPQAAVAAGVDVVTFSGDKLLGGPQAGLIVGPTDLLARIRGHPLARAVRLDKLSLAALAATLRQYMDPAGVWEEIPVLRMLAATEPELETRARDLAAALGPALGDRARVEVVATVGEVGGGSLPQAHLASRAVAIHPRSGAEGWERALRALTPPVIGRLREGALLLDVRTLQPGEDRLLVDLLAQAADAVDGEGAAG